MMWLLAKLSDNPYLGCGHTTVNTTVTGMFVHSDVPYYGNP